MWGGQSGTGAGLLRVLRIPLKIFFPMNVPHTSIKRIWYNTSTNDGPQMGSWDRAVSITVLGRLDDEK
jgi:hypothetical protein